MTTYQILMICGIGTLSSLVITFLFNLLVNMGKKKQAEQKKQIEEQNKKIQDLKNDVDGLREDIELLKQGTQALLRNQLYETSDRFNDKGYATVEEKNNFENMYKKYHNLGKNGVMDNLYEAVLDMPTNPPSNNHNNNHNKYKK